MEIQTRQSHSIHGSWIDFGWGIDLMLTGDLILLADRAAQERETSRQVEAQRLDYEEQIFKLKQENFVLAARVGAL